MVFRRRIGKAKRSWKWPKSVRGSPMNPFILFSERLSVALANGSGRWTGGDITAGESKKKRSILVNSYDVPRGTVLRSVHTLPRNGPIPCCPCKHKILKWSALIIYLLCFLEGARSFMEKRRLGRGLDALLGSASDGVSTKTEQMHVAIEQIEQ